MAGSEICAIYVCVASEICVCRCVCRVNLRVCRVNLRVCRVNVVCMSCKSSCMSCKCCLYVV